MYTSNDPERIGKKQRRSDLSIPIELNRIPSLSEQPLPYREAKSQDLALRQSRPEDHGAHKNQTRGSKEEAIHGSRKPGQGQGHLREEQFALLIISDSSQ